MKKLFLILLLFGVLSVQSNAQTDDPVLFTVDGNPVHVSEFLYIYQKNNGTKADFSAKSLQEYLDLYTKFKLKVTKARQMKLDTIPELIQELAGYRKQLSKSYLVDKEVNEKLIREVYERRQFDLNVSHILISNNTEREAEKDAQAKAKIFFLHHQLQDGANFEQLARENSDDKTTAQNGGALGFITAMLPNGFYEFENQAYALKPGQFSQPFKTDYGYHIVKLNGMRPARGQVEGAHILVKRRTGESTQDEMVRIDSIYQRLLAGDSFEELARKHSQDKKTNIKGGYIGLFGINKFERAFEEAVFGLEQDGDFSKPFKSSAGWHIVKRISKTDLEDFDRAKRSISAEISRDGRFEIAKKALIEEIKKQAGYTQDTAALSFFVSQLDPGFYSLYWEKPESLNRELFRLGDKSYSLEDFASFCEQRQRERMRYGKETDLALAANQLFESYVNDECMEYEESQLDVKYPDFKSLMREYDEGILLFEATKRAVWDKASQDTAGLRIFYKSNKDKYLWQARADLFEYVIHTDQPGLVEKIHSLAGKKGHEKLIEKYNRENQLITFSRKKVEVGSRELTGLEWEKKALSALEPDTANGVFRFKMINDILPPSPKSLDEARGYVIADYQEYLEKNWVESLRKEFDVHVNEPVFKGLIADK